MGPHLGFPNLGIVQASSPSNSCYYFCFSTCYLVCIIHNIFLVTIVDNLPMCSGIAHVLTILLILFFSYSSIISLSFPLLCTRQSYPTHRHESSAVLELLQSLSRLCILVLSNDPREGLRLDLARNSLSDDGWLNVVIGWNEILLKEGYYRI